MKKARIPFLSIILVVMALVITHVMLNQNKEVVQAEELYEEISETVKVMPLESETEAEPETEIAVQEILEEPKETEYVSEVDFEALHEKNPDTVAWITVDGTRIDYPVLFDGTDGYLKKSIEGKKSATGSLFVDEKAEDPFNDFLTIIYGHHMKNGSMFAAVDDFSYDDFWNRHQGVTVYSDDCKREYSPYLCVVGKGDADIRSISDIGSLSSFCEGKTVTQGNIPEEIPQTIVLITCNYSGSDYRTYLFCGIDD